MGFLKRIRQIISANIDHLIENAEEPEIMIEQFIREMDEGIMNLRTEVARAIAAEKRLARRMEDGLVKIRTWQEDSERAVMEGNDALARKAIANRLDEEKALAELEGQHKKALAVSETMKEDLRLLENKIQEARRRKENLVARKRSAQAQKDTLSSNEKLTGASGKTDSLVSKAQRESSFTLETLEDEVLEMEAETEALREVTKSKPQLEQTLEDTEREENIERILHEIKDKPNK